MTQTHDIEAIFRRVLEAVEHQDVDRLMEFFAEDAVTVDYTNPTVVIAGRPAIAGHVRERFAMFRDIGLEVVSLVASESRLATEIIIRGTPPRMAEAMELFYAGFYAFRDGKIVSERLYVDSVQLPAAASEDREARRIPEGADPRLDGRSYDVFW